LKNKKRDTLLILFPFLLLLNSCLSTSGNNEKGINNSLLQLIDQAVFEVVVKKTFDSPDTIDLKNLENRSDEIIEDPLTYAKDLPWDLVSYANRIDEYISIGTAFAISENELITAAHVLNLHNKTLSGEYYLRSKSGQVYELDTITKHANDRDFTIFTAVGLDNMKYFDLEYDYQLNSKVYAVGNALGEGIIVRDGLLTSTTKEVENGRWDFLRYSAAASPGNSGGPLLNDKGDVVGIVLRKSENENLNYALPISEAINAEENVAVYHFFGQYGLSITQRKYGPVKYTEKVKLPLHYTELRDSLSEIYSETNENSIKELNKKYSQTMFPYGEGSLRLLQKSNSFLFPYIAAENEEDGNWDAYKPNEVQNSNLTNNGFISFGKMAEFTSIQFRKPLDMKLETLMNDSESFIKTFLEAYPLNRNVGNESIRITSLGKASEISNFTDRYDRTWYVQSWNIDFADSKLKIYAMPVPSGFIALSLLSSTGNVDQVSSLDLQEYLNYVFFSYSGTFKEWKEYLDLDFPRSAIFNDTEFSYIPGESASFKNKTFQIDYSEDLLSIEEKSNLILRASYSLKDDNPAWEPIGIVLTDNFTGDNYLKLLKKDKPHSSLPEVYHENWKSLLNEKFPFDQSVNMEDQLSYIDALQKQFSGSATDESEYLYFVEVGKEGTIDKEAMIQDLQMMQDSVTIFK
jgi:hypothetical protein